MKSTNSSLDRAGTEQTPHIAASEHETRNFRLILTNGILIRGAFRFADPSMVLAAFVKRLTESNLMVGLTSSTMRAGWMWPQLFMSNLLEHRPRKMPFYLAGFATRVICWVFILVLTLLVGDGNPLLLFCCFYFLYFVGSSGMGIGTLPFNDIVAKAIPVRRRARLFSLRSLLGGLFSVIAGLVIRYILDDDFSLSFPYNYASMFGIYALIIACSSTSFILVKEPIQPVRDSRRPLWQHLKRGPHFLKADRDYKYFMLLRMTASFGSMGVPFYIPYALDQIRISESAVGSYTAIGAISAVLSNLLWVYAVEKRGSRSLLIISASIACIAPIIPILVGYLPASQQPAFYSLVFVLTQALMNAQGIGYMTYSLNMSPSMSRPTYLGFLNTMMFPMSFVPVLAGGLLKIISYRWLFALAAAISVLSVHFALNLSNVDERDDIETKDDD